MAFEKFEPVFGETKAEWEQGARGAARPCLYYVRALDSSRLQVVASDFHSAWGRTLTVLHLEDLRDETGIGSSWSDFFDYFMSSLSSGDVKLVLNSLPNMAVDSGGGHAVLIVHKSKGLPCISLSLSRLMNTSANDATADLAMAIFKAFKRIRHEIVKEQERSVWLTRMLSLEKERNESLQKQLDAHSSLGKRKIPAPETSFKASPISDTLSYSSTMFSETQKPLEMPSAKGSQSMRVKQQAIAIYSRSKSRGVFLQSNNDGGEN